MVVRDLGLPSFLIENENERAQVAGTSHVGSKPKSEVKGSQRETIIQYRELNLRSLKPCPGVLAEKGNSPGYLLHWRLAL